MSKSLSELELDELDTLFLNFDFLTALIRFEVCQNLDPKEEIPTITSNNIGSQQLRATSIGLPEEVRQYHVILEWPSPFIYIQTAIVKSV